MQPSLLEEIPAVPNPYPVVSKVEYPEVWRLCTQARDLAWDPVKDIDYSDLKDADLPLEVRTAGAEWPCDCACLSAANGGLGTTRFLRLCVRLFDQRNAVDCVAPLAPRLQALRLRMCRQCMCVRLCVCIHAYVHVCVRACTRSTCACARTVCRASAVASCATVL